MTTYFCKWCGENLKSENDLLNTECFINPEGKHEIYENYEGGEGKWTCKYCGRTTVKDLKTFINMKECSKSPSGYCTPL